MNYIFLAAGMGTRLNPFTKSTPKCLIKIGKNETILERSIRLIKSKDKEAKITIVVGYNYHLIEEKIKGCDFIYNPFYKITNSVASLWFARHLLQEEVTIINGDIVFDKNILELLIKKVDKPQVFMDSSIKSGGDYNVQLDEKTGKIVVMGKNLTEYSGEYVGITKLDDVSSKLLKTEIENFVNNDSYNDWYETALVQMILSYDFEVYSKDVENFNWTEVDCIDDLLKARQIQFKDDIK